MFIHIEPSILRLFVVGLISPVALMRDFFFSAGQYFV
jgi:hypothetical protein